MPISVTPKRADISQRIKQRKQRVSGPIARSVRWFGCLLCLAIPVWSALYWMSSIAGMHLDPHQPQDLERLHQIAHTSQPLLAALETFKRERGMYPETLSKLYPTYLPSPPADERGSDNWKGWYYTRDAPDHFDLSRSINWDACLYYHLPRLEAGDWYFDPGDGRPGMTLPF